MERIRRTWRWVRRSFRNVLSETSTVSETPEPPEPVVKHPPAVTDQLTSTETLDNSNDSIFTLDCEPVSWNWDTPDQIHPNDDRHRDVTDVSNSDRELHWQGRLVTIMLRGDRSRLIQSSTSAPVTEQDCKLDSYTIAKLLRADGFTVQDVFLIDNKRQCVIVTNCEENAEAMEPIRLRLKAQNYVLYVRPLVKQVDCVELMSDQQPQNSNSEFVLVIEEHPKNLNRETTWCTNTMFLVEKNPNKEISSKFYALTTFHVFKMDEFVDESCYFGSCGCCGSSSKDDFSTYWRELKKERRCKSPKKRADLIEHLNRLIEKRTIYLSLLKTDHENGQRIAVKYIVAADYQVTRPQDEKFKDLHLLDCVLLKLDDEHVTKLNNPNFSFLRTVRTAYDETRFLTEMNQDKLIEPLVCCGRSMFPSEISDRNQQFPNSHLDYRRAILTTSRLRVLGLGQSGSLLLHLTKEEDEDKKQAVAVGYLQRYEPMHLPKQHEDHWDLGYTFTRIDEQLKALREFNSNYPFNRPVINELVLPMLES